MNNKLQRNATVVAGLVRALCRCCDEPRQLRAHARLASTSLVCPETRMTYEDRGDGLFEPDGSKLDAAWELDEPMGDPDPGAPELLSDRPSRTGPKTRISLERATFAGLLINHREHRAHGGRTGGGFSRRSSPSVPSVCSVVRSKSRCQRAS